MAHYNYKEVTKKIPYRILNQYKDSDPNYDGDLWLAARDYIEELEQDKKRLDFLEETSSISCNDIDHDKMIVEMKK